MTERPRGGRFAWLSAALSAAVLLLIAFVALDRVPPGPSLGPGDLNEIRARVEPRLDDELAAVGLSRGASVFIRIFKQDSVLELWLADGATYRLFRSYPICAYSGTLGPKLKEGDGQAPEGVYTVTTGQLNPRSSYHLSFDLGFPNAYDRAQGRTGSFLMVHGRCASIGCYAMTDPGIEEIYLLVEAALKAGQGAVPVHAFPFRMEGPVPDGPWAGFWRDLQQIYRRFESTRVPPDVAVRNGRYSLV